MKHLSAFLGVLLLASAAHGQGARLGSNAIQARTIYHSDHTRTESVRNPETHELTETTYDVNNVVISRHIYLLNDAGQVMQGNIYDGAGNQIARSQSWFDEFGRVKESRLMNPQGETFQQTLYEYGPDGKAKKPKVINYNVKTPTMRPAVVDFTGTTAPAGGTPPTGRAAGSAATAPPAAEEKPKRSFFGRLFGKKEKKQ
ncbi:MAG: hypothetical protein K1X78_08415 [Verrucomicrobiaceae bacterium]|nr:hypothetical protein [Verrucomicrobiaceae bacterium]